MAMSNKAISSLLWFFFIAGIIHLSGSPFSYYTIRLAYITL